MKSGKKAVNTLIYLMVLHVNIFNLDTGIWEKNE